MINKAARILTLPDARLRARKILPRVLFEYIDGGAEQEKTRDENERIFSDLNFRPRMGLDVAPDLRLKLLGHELSMPIILAPMGMIQLCHPDGAIGVARAANSAGIISILSRTAQFPLEPVADNSTGPYWYQITSLGGRENAALSMERAAKAGYETLVVTLDGPPPGNRQAEARHGVMPPVVVTPGMIASFTGQALSRPNWTVRTLAALVKNRATVAATRQTLSSDQLNLSVRFTWSDIEWIAREWPGHVLVKGVLTGDDAILAREAGADAIIVSNHGGRALDSSPASLSALAEVAAAVGATTPVLLDGGVRWAGDVVKALCLGANAVLIGRPFAWGLACAGQPGVDRVLEIMRSELTRTLRLMGCPNLGALGPQWIQPRMSSSSLPEAISRALQRVQD